MLESVKRKKLFNSRIDYLEQMYDAFCFTCAADIFDLLAQEFPEDEFSFKEVEELLYIPEEEDSKLIYKHMM